VSEVDALLRHATAIWYAASEGERFSLVVDYANDRIAEILGVAVLRYQKAEQRIAELEQCNKELLNLIAAHNIESLKRITELERYIKILTAPEVK
jgi:hypothetical protein